MEAAKEENNMSFFMDPNITLSNKLLEVVYIIIGLITFYAGIKNLFDKENPSRIGTAIFWCFFGVACAFGQWIPSKITGILVVIMVIPAIFKRVKPGKQVAASKKYSSEQFKKIGMKIFIPALCMGVMALIFALFTKISSLVGITVGVMIAMILLMLYSKDNKPKVFLDDSERFLSMMGPLSLLPQLLACLGGIFTAAGVGEVISKIVGMVVPAGNVNLGIIVFGIGMVLFTAIMGNAFAAITVMTVGIGAPFVLAYGADPVLIGAVALTTGFCGTLLTPMAANFNIVPVALLDMKDRFGVIKNQIVVALIMIVVQITYMILMK